MDDETQIRQPTNDPDIFLDDLEGNGFTSDEETFLDQIESTGSLRGSFQE